MVDYVAKLRADLIEQFKGKPVIDALNEAIGEQMNDLRQFFDDLKNKRSLYTAEGKQLDGIGDIVVLDRTEAGALACVKESVHVLEDEDYRKFLIYKIWKNTNNCTYYDIIKSFRMFWDNPMYYSENPEYPATMFFETEILNSADDVRKLLNAPYVKAAGVGIHITIRVETTPLVAGIGTAIVCVSGCAQPAIATRNKGTHSDLEAESGILTGIVAVSGVERPAIATRNRGMQSDLATDSGVVTGIVAVGGIGRPTIAMRNAESENDGVVNTTVSTSAVAVSERSAATAT